MMSPIANFKLLCAIAVALGGASAAVSAQTATSQGTADSAIAAQPLEEALKIVERRTGLQIVYVTALVEGKYSKGAPAGLPATQALTHVLEGTGLTFKFLTDHTVAIQSPRESGASVAQSPGMQRIAQAQAVAETQNANGPQATTSNGGAAAADTSAVTLDEVIVQGLRFHGPEASTALKVPLSIKDTPQTVVAITGDMMDFASIKTFKDVYRVDPTGGATHRVDNASVNYFRGFLQQSNNAIKVDGFRLRSSFNLDFAPFERLELVKGATSTMYGQNSIAGTLNAISKMPKSEFGGELKAEIGSFDHYRVDADIYGPLTDDGALAYRLVGARLDEDSYLDYAGKKTTVIAPTLRYQIGEDTTVFARVNYQKTDSVTMWGGGLQYLGDWDEAYETGFDPALLVMPNLPRSHFNGASWNNAEHEAKLIQAGLEHGFDNGWVLRAYAQRNKQDIFYAREFTALFQADGVPLHAVAERNDNRFTLEGAEVNLYGDIELWGRPQTLFIGADYSSLENPLLYSRVNVNSPSIFDPTFNTAVPPVRSLTDYTVFSQYRSVQKNTGATAQVFIRPLDGLILLVGGRYSKDENGTRSRCCGAGVLAGTVPYNKAEVKVDSFTMQTGVTYALTQNLNLYASYGETYSPQTGLVNANTYVDPEEGTATEIGLKGAHSERFSYSLALFDMERTNIAQSRPGTVYVDPIGTQRSRGVEAEFQGTIVRGWELFGALGWMKAEFADGQYKGLQPVEAPRFGLSLFTSYELQQGPLRGVGIGAGVVHKRGRETFFIDLGPDGRPLAYDFGDFTEVDLRVFRNTEHWRLQLSVTNLLNEEYFTSDSYNGLDSGIHINPARTVIGQASYRF
ncbi:TonB-dependent siderophore receptor [Steroidobacter sp.]|uniref:TonB-dependent siderophore receptor n=1 Tax=Steroidobacter sp. TaxID=1978227 RepID=UPI001A61376D|nr:TonB-dependent receptor [Steroidobacter sp.]MBL8265986.1 TonB-dependent receptor [Steroidobacter sp.]